jgi:alpha-tubulin suppressor-like RCC1 family protein
MAIRSDNTLWAFGYNNTGQLGLNDATNRSSPVQVGTSSWSSVSAGYTHTMAIGSSSTLWAWGGNINGILGIDINTLSPIQVGTSSWTSVSAGRNHTMALAN